MVVLIAIGLLAGLVAGVSPCVLPVLPVIFFGSGVGAPVVLPSGPPGLVPLPPATSGARNPALHRPLLIVAGLVASFAILTLAGSSLLSTAGLPQGFLRWTGLIVLLLIGLGLLFPRVEHLLQLPFRRFRLPSRPGGAGGHRSDRPTGNGFLLGLGLGALYVPCAGPVLAAISIAGTSRHLTGAVVLLTVAFAIGVAIPLLAFALAGAGVARRLTAYRHRARRFRTVAGVVMMLLATALTFNLTDALQREVPAYTQALQQHFEENSAARMALAGLNAPVPSSDRSTTGVTSKVPRAPVRIGREPNASGVAPPASGPVVSCVSHAKVLANCGPAPAIVGISAWINTAQGLPVTLTQLRGKVVLVNFWTFSCINCQRALPAIRSWYTGYHSSGLEVIGVHTPEFAYEHDLGNVKEAVSGDGLKYPVGLDNSSATWVNYHNSYWPAEYLIDADGVVRHVVFGEGGYADSETLIRSLLRAARPGVVLPPPTMNSVPAG